MKSCLYCDQPYVRDGDRFWCDNPACPGSVGNPRSFVTPVSVRPSEPGIDTFRASMVCDALTSAVAAACASPCAKSKRGVAVFHPRRGVLGTGCNRPPTGFACDGSAKCREHCGKLCLHAEPEALRRAQDREGGMAGDYELVHVKVVAQDGDYVRVPSKDPSCWQCSRTILAYGIVRVWLLHATDEGKEYLQPYTAHDFHRQTLEHCGLPVILDDHHG